MRKFSDIQTVNEEFLKNIFKRKENDTYVKSSKALLEMYCKNLLEEKYIHLRNDEKENFDFSMFKVKSISKDDTSKYTIIISTFSSELEELGDLKYKVQI